MKYKLNVNSDTILNIDSNSIKEFSEKNHIPAVHIFYYVRRSKNSVSLNKKTVKNSTIKFGDFAIYCNIGERLRESEKNLLKK